MQQPQLPDIRTRARSALRREIADVATALILEQGFEDTTVDQLASATGVSRRTFFRLFPTKEDVVMSVSVGHGAITIAALRERPADEHPWVALRNAFGAAMEAVAASESSIAIHRLIYNTPALYRAMLELRSSWTPELAEELARRMRRAPDDLRPKVLATAALGVSNVAVDRWSDEGGTTPLSTLLDDAFATLADELRDA